MKSSATSKSQFSRSKIHLAIAALFAALSPQLAADPVNVQVTGSDGAPVTGFRWLLEEDATKDSIPGLPADGSNLSLGFHTSYMPVVASGRAPARLCENA